MKIVGNATMSLLLIICCVCTAQSRRSRAVMQLFCTLLRQQGTFRRCTQKSVLLFVVCSSLLAVHSKTQGGMLSPLHLATATLSLLSAQVSLLSAASFCHPHCMSLCTSVAESAVSACFTYTCHMHCTDQHCPIRLCWLSTCFWS